MRPYRQAFAGAPVYCPIAPDIPQALSGSALAMRFNMRSVASRLVGTLRRHRMGTEYDGVHIHDMRYAGLAYPIWRQGVSGKAVLTLHGVDPFMEARTESRWLAQRLTALWEAVDCVTLVGRPLRNYVERLGVSRQKRMIVPNGTDLPAEWSSRQRPPGEVRRIVSVSNLVALKGIDLNLSALGRIVVAHPRLQWEYRIVGDGPERQALEALAGSLGLADRVRFLGRLDHQRTLDEIAGADIFSLPSWGENFGIVYLEALARGKPIIGCRDWGAADIIEDGAEGLLVAPRETASLEFALARLLLDPDECAAMGARGWVTSERFTWRANAERYLSIFNGQTKSPATSVEHPPLMARLPR